MTDQHRSPSVAASLRRSTSHFMARWFYLKGNSNLPWLESTHCKYGNGFPSPRAFVSNTFEQYLTHQHRITHDSTPDQGTYFTAKEGTSWPWIMTMLIITLTTPPRSYCLMDQRNSIFKGLRCHLEEDIARRVFQPPGYNIHSKSISIIWYYILTDRIPGPKKQNWN